MQSLFPQALSTTKLRFSLFSQRSLLTCKAFQSGQTPLLFMKYHLKYSLARRLKFCKSSRTRHKEPLKLFFLAIWYSTTSYMVLQTVSGLQLSLSNLSPCYLSWISAYPLTQEFFIKLWCKYVHLIRFQLRIFCTKYLTYSRRRHTGPIFRWLAMILCGS